MLNKMQLSSRCMRWQREIGRPVRAWCCRLSGMKFRPDIEGLRALAIVPVVVFHAWPEILPGGFVGVDVFFVISGYLITTLLLQQLASGKVQRGVVLCRLYFEDNHLSMH